MGSPSESPSSCGFTFLSSIKIQNTDDDYIGNVYQPCEDIEDEEDEDKTCEDIEDEEDEPCKNIEELCKESLVHVARHLVENQPVAQRAVLDIVTHLFSGWKNVC